ncbi:hypothetical protein PIB30_012793 [Stylosanthes scabra]|uniref:Uncharacterized protein n=1 Tax=Stylosanthes scabra TaxID=79078 RepID=A0ABU6T734_9FABA|nr:hypothetical protein [Stylosanthes scabra]
MEQMLMQSLDMIKSVEFDLEKNNRVLHAVVLNHTRLGKEKFHSVHSCSYIRKKSWSLFFFSFKQWVENPVLSRTLPWISLKTVRPDVNTNTFVKIWLGTDQTTKLRKCHSLVTIKGGPTPNSSHFSLHSPQNVRENQPRVDSKSARINSHAVHVDF